MAQSERERRAAQRELARQIREGTYKPSPIGARARRAAGAYKTTQDRYTRQAAQPTQKDLAEEQFGNVAHLIGGAPDVVYEPTRSSNPSDPRTARMEYYRAARVVKVYWGDLGRSYLYFQIDPALWNRWMKSSSPGRFINRVLIGKSYMPSPF